MNQSSFSLIHQIPTEIWTEYLAVHLTKKQASPFVFSCKDFKENCNELLVRDRIKIAVSVIKNKLDMASIFAYHSLERLKAVFSVFESVIEFKDVLIDSSDHPNFAYTTRCKLYELMSINILPEYPKDTRLRIINIANKLGFTIDEDYNIIYYNDYFYEDHDDYYDEGDYDNYDDEEYYYDNYDDEEYYYDNYDEEEYLLL